MKRKLLCAVAGMALSLGGLGVVGVGSASAAPGVSEFCTTYGDFGTTHGACVSYFETENLTAFVADLCKDPFWQSWTGTTNTGQCIKVLKPLVI